ncbi:MAG: hypothetical protein MHMPM18_003232 [Marteilia pararefringens]
MSSSVSASNSFNNYPNASYLVKELYEEFARKIERKTKRIAICCSICLLLSAVVTFGSFISGSAVAHEELLVLNISLFSIAFTLLLSTFLVRCPKLRKICCIVTVKDWLKYQRISLLVLLAFLIINFAIHLITIVSWDSATASYYIPTSIVSLILILLSVSYNIYAIYISLFEDKKELNSTIKSSFVNSDIRTA